MNKMGAMLYLGERTIYSQLTKLYLFEQKSDYFNLVHTESSIIVENLKEQGVDIGEFVYYQGFQGPIKIWEVKYPEDIKSNPEYLKTVSPKGVTAVKEGEYN